MQVQHRRLTLPPNLETLMTARARCVDGQTLYDVTYDHCRDLDKAVPYGYLRRLAARGITVYVGGTSCEPPHVIPAVSAAE